MANQTGIAIVIKAFLPTGKTLDEQFNALSIVREAHATGDYATLLKAASVEDVKTEQKTRRIEDKTAAETFDPNDPDFAEIETEAAPDDAENGPVGTQGIDPDTGIADGPAADADVPEFLKKGKSAKAA